MFAVGIIADKGATEAGQRDEDALVRIYDIAFLVTFETNNQREGWCVLVIAFAVVGVFAFIPASTAPDRSKSAA